MRLPLHAEWRVYQCKVIHGYLYFFHQMKVVAVYVLFNCRVQRKNGHSDPHIDKTNVIVVSHPFDTHCLLLAEADHGKLEQKLLFLERQTKQEPKGHSMDETNRHAMGKISITRTASSLFSDALFWLQSRSCLTLRRRTCSCVCSSTPTASSADVARECTSTSSFTCMLALFSDNHI